VASWTFLTNHARVLLCIAYDPGARLRDIAASLNITERSAFGIVTDLADAGYVVKQKDGRRNRYQIQAHLPMPEPTSQERTVGDVLALLVGTNTTRARYRQPSLFPATVAQRAGNSARVTPATSTWMGCCKSRVTGIGWLVVVGSISIPTYAR